jgi:hypothetical protein
LIKLSNEKLLHVRPTLHLILSRDLNQEGKDRRHRFHVPLMREGNMHSKFMLEHFKGDAL